MYGGGIVGDGLRYLDVTQSMCGLDTRPVADAAVRTSLSSESSLDGRVLDAAHPRHLVICLAVVLVVRVRNLPSSRAGAAVLSAASPCPSPCHPNSRSDWS